MTIAQTIELTLLLLQTALAAAKVQGVPLEAISIIEDSIAKLESVKGTDVTWQQLQNLRTAPAW